MAENNTEMSTGRKVLIGVIAVLLLLTVAAYGFGVYYFTRHFLPGSLVNGFNCSYMDETGSGGTSHPGDGRLCACGTDKRQWTGKYFG